ncbi:MAG: baseplate J/gp47 family protein, partial [Caldilineaceae bacterium]|nr:baseplate J/gp47 family protein [Caldilineaceae bacterium]
PLIAPTDDEVDLLVEVEENGQWVRWQEVTNFSGLTPESRVYIADRTEGTIRFAPAVNMTVAGGLARMPRTLAALPSAGAPIRLSYAYGGGNAGNVAAQRLTTILPSPVMPTLIAGLSVTNPAPAVGGQDGETLANALQRGPQEIYSLERAITARDFERLAVTPGVGISRAKAFTQLERWAHGTRGTVEIRLVPNRPTAETDLVQLTRARQQEGEAALEIQTLRRILLDSQPMGTAVDLQWANYKEVWVETHVTLKERASASAVRARLLPALNSLLSPLPQPAETSHQGWPFGQTLYTSDIHRLLVEDEGVDAITRLQLCVAAAPNRAVTALAADHFQPHTWYAASDRRLFRSFNDGEGWELAPNFPAAEADVRQETIRLIEPSADRPG